jgi:hypothetical protein
MKRSIMASGQPKKRTLSMMMDPHFDFQPLEPDVQKQNFVLMMFHLDLEFPAMWVART